MRSFENMAILFIIFVPVVIGISQVAPGFAALLIGDALAIIFVYYLYCLWNRRPIQVRCGDCRKVISSNTPWVCGFCQEPNRNANEFPFVFECGHCHDEPKAYRCHHCNKLVFLSEDKDKRNYAYSINDPGGNEQQESLTKKKMEKEEKEHQISVAELELKLKTIVDKRDGPKIKPPAERKIEAFDAELAACIGVKAHAAKRRAELAVELKDHPELYEQACVAIDELLERLS